MFFVDSYNEIINVNAIVIIPAVPENADDKYILDVVMVDGRTQSIYAKDVLAIRELVISRLL